MFASLLTLALAASSVTAAPVLQERKEAPDHWATNYLEDYMQYHTRYIALDCQKKHDDVKFFDDCCRPLTTSQKLEDRPSECRPAEDAIQSAAARIAKNAASNTASAALASATVSAAAGEQPGDDNAGAEFFAASTSVAAASEAAPSPTSTQEAPKPSPTEEKKEEEPKKEENQNQGGNAVKSFTAGKATHFTPWDGTGISFSQDPQPGNCGYKWSDYGGLGGNWVALKTSLYKAPGVDNEGRSAYCGKKVRLTSKANGASVEATILDSCPSCGDEGHIDVSPSVFNALQDVVKINLDNDDQPANDPGELEVDWEILA